MDESDARPDMRDASSWIQLKNLHQDLTSGKGYVRRSPSLVHLVKQTLSSSDGECNKNPELCNHCHQLLLLTNIKMMLDADVMSNEDDSRLQSELTQKEEGFTGRQMHVLDYLECDDDTLGSSLPLVGMGEDAGHQIHIQQLVDGEDDIVGHQIDLPHVVAKNKNSLGHLTELPLVAEGKNKGQQTDLPHMVGKNKNTLGHQTGLPLVAEGGDKRQQIDLPHIVVGDKTHTGHKIGLLQLVANEEDIMACNVSSSHLVAVDERDLVRAKDKELNVIWNKSLLSSVGIENLITWLLHLLKSCNKFVQYAAAKAILSAFKSKLFENHKEKLLGSIVLDLTSGNSFQPDASLQLLKSLMSKKSGHQVNQMTSACLKLFFSKLCSFSWGNELTKSSSEVKLSFLCLLQKNIKYINTLDRLNKQNELRAILPFVSDSLVEFLFHQTFLIQETPSKQSDLPLVPPNMSDLPFLLSKTNDLPCLPRKTSDLPFLPSKTSDLPLLPNKTTDLPFLSSKTSGPPLQQTSYMNTEFDKSSNDSSSLTNEYPSLLRSCSMETTYSRILYKKVLDIFNTILCYGDNLSENKYDSEVHDLYVTLSSSVLTRVSKQGLGHIPYSSQFVGFGGKEFKSEHFVADFTRAGDLVLLRKLFLLLFKMFAVSIKSSDKVTENRVCLEKVTDCLQQVNKYVWNVLSLNTDVGTTVTWLPDVFRDQDDAWIESLLCLLDVYLFQLRDAAAHISLATTLNPHKLFLQFLNSTTNDHTILVDLLTSPETCFLLYLIRYLKCVITEWDTFIDVCHKTYCISDHQGDGCIPDHDCDEYPKQWKQADAQEDDCKVTTDVSTKQFPLRSLKRKADCVSPVNKVNETTASSERFLRNWSTDFEAKTSTDIDQTSDSTLKQTNEKRFSFSYTPHCRKNKYKNSNDALNSLASYYSDGISSSDDGGEIDDGNGVNDFGDYDGGGGGIDDGVGNGDDGVADGVRNDSNDGGIDDGDGVRNDSNDGGIDYYDGVGNDDGGIDDDVDYDKGDDDDSDDCTDQLLKSEHKPASNLPYLTNISNKPFVLVDYDDDSDDDEYDDEHSNVVDEDCSKVKGNVNMNVFDAGDDGFVYHADHGDSLVRIINKPCNHDKPAVTMLGSCNKPQDQSEKCHSRGETCNNKWSCVDQVLATFIRMRLKITKLHNHNLFPYNPQPLLSVLQLCEDKYELMSA